ncbi:hypothetical protein [Winogradskyella sp. 3972H.M.0a.05]|uniref:hypothetical protein n=1 Tax=Winogradskyella sp. 3972H.M.0a.05 TaxID=2950277 RepID=UPI0033927788
MGTEKKDIWDKLKILSGILIPIAIAYAGHIFAVMQHKAEMEIQNNQFDHQRQVSITNSKVGQVNLVSSFFEALLSDSPKRKKLAIQSILIALPEEGPQLVKVVSESDEEQELKEFANKTLKDKRNKLAEGLFSEDKSIRLSSYQEIMTGWKNDQEIVISIIDFGEQNLSNKDGIYNALVTLSHLNKATLLKYSSLITEFSKKAEVNGEKTKERAIKLRERIPEK